MPIHRASSFCTTGFDVPYAPPKLEHHYLPDVDRILDAIDTLYPDEA